MYPKFKDYFHFNRRQQKGLLIIMGLIFILILANRFAYLLADDPIPPEVKYLDSLVQDEKAKPADKSKINVPSDKPVEVELFPFDPNELDMEGWLALGLTQNQAQVILNYREKGGRFYEKDELKKIYSIDDSLYARLEPYIQIQADSSDYAEDTVEINREEIHYRKYEKVVIDINTADTSLWQQLYGIGPVYARRIVKYREALGGFYAMDQLTEVWGLNDTLLQRLRPQLKMDSIRLHKISVNSATVEQLQAHPYLNWNESNAIVKYRENHGPYLNQEALSEVKILSPELIAKLAPYLTFTE
jgi:competence ComEA-like helix-hairpin-helix protein